MAPIGVFDSGVGGLTVLKALKQRWPAENFVYLADTARLPYGSKSLHTISHYVEQCARFLLESKPKAIVVACNSASAALLQHPLKLDVPIFNVIEPGARKAVEVSAAGRIGVLGTRATVYAEAYVRALKKLKDSVEVVQQACPLWVPLVEEGMVDDPITNLIVYRYVQPLLQKQVDTLILGCTHFPVLRNSVVKAAGAGVELVDSSHGLIEDLKELNLREDSSAGKIDILCTDYSPRLEETIHFLLGDIRYNSLEAVDIKLKA